MSTTRIIAVVIFFAAIIVIPLVIIYIWFPLTLGRYIGLVENIIAGVIGGLIITLLIDFTIRRREKNALEKVARVGLSEASHQVNRMMGLFAAMVKASSTGFIPKSMDELFDAEAADLISLHLDLYKPAPVTPQILWPQYMSNETRYVLSKLSEVQNHYQSFFPENVTAEIAELRNNRLLLILQNVSGMVEVDIRENIKCPVLNIIPPDALRQSMKDILNCVKTLQQDANRLKTTTAPHFPHFTFREDVLPKLGDSRYEGLPGPPIVIVSLDQ